MWHPSAISTNNSFHRPSLPGPGSAVATVDPGLFMQVVTTYSLIKFYGSMAYGLWTKTHGPMVNGLWTNPHGPMAYGLWTKPHGSLAYGLWRQKPMVLWSMVYGRKPMVLWRQKRIDSIGVNPFGSRSGTRTRVSTVRGWRANRYTNRPLFELCGSRSGTRTRVSTVRGWRANRYTNRPFGYISEIQPLPFEARLFPVCECKVTNKFSLHQIF